MNLTRLNERAWDSLAKDLRNDILSGRLQSGEAIRTELQLANNYNISRNSVRKAIDALVAEGLLKRVQGSGTYVAQIREQIREASVSRRQILFLSMETELCDECAHGTFVPIFDYISNILDGKGLNLLYSSIDFDYKPPASLLNKDVCGVIFHGTMPVQFWERYIAPLPAVGLQYDRPEIDCNWVKIDNFQRSYQAVKYLHSLGHTRIGFVTNEIEQRLSRERFEAYMKSMEIFGLQVNENWIINWQRERTNGLLLSEEYTSDYQKHLEKALKVKSEMPTALICADNHRALFVEKALDQMGVRIPDDISLVGGFNHSKDALQKFTSIDDRLGDLCQEAIALLLGDIEGSNNVKNKTVIIRPELYIGKSTLPIRTSKNQGEKRK